MEGEETETVHGRHFSRNFDAKREMTWQLEGDMEKQQLSKNGKSNCMYIFLWT